MGDMSNETKENISSPIETPIERQHSKGKPTAISHFDVELNNRQKEILEQLPNFDSRVTVPRKTVNMSDLAALTAKTGVEFSMFTKGNERLIIRGNNLIVNFSPEEARELSAQGYRWSGHTHPGADSFVLNISSGDYKVLAEFNQKQSIVYNSMGEFITFPNIYYQNIRKTED